MAEAGIGDDGGSLQVHLPGIELHNDRTFHLTAVEMEDGVEVGVRAPLAADYTVDAFPVALHDEIEAITGDVLDWDRLTADVGSEDLVDVGRLALGPGEDGHVRLTVAWEPAYHR